MFSFQDNPTTCTVNALHYVRLACSWKFNAKGLIKAMKEQFPDGYLVRCLFHQLETMLVTKAAWFYNRLEKKQRIDGCEWPHKPVDCCSCRRIIHQTYSIYSS